MGKPVRTRGSQGQPFPSDAPHAGRLAAAALPRPTSGAPASGDAPSEEPASPARVSAARRAPGPGGSAAPAPRTAGGIPAPGARGEAGADAGATAAHGAHRAAFLRHVGLGDVRVLAAEAALLVTYVRRVLPLVDEALDRWQRRAAAIPDPELRRQALASIRTKRFHCEGGAVFAAAVPPARRRALVEAVVALQTISDYLDNLCDRSESLDPADYRQLHRAMLDAVTPAGTAAGAPPSAAGASATTAMRAMAPEGGGHRDAAAARPSGLRATAPASRCRRAPPVPPLARRPDAPSRPGPGPSPVAPVAPASPPAPPGAANGYYRLHPHGDDGGYLEALVATCRAALATFPGYGAVAGAVRRLVSLYNDLQVNKHGDPRGRQARMAAWYRRAAGRWHGRLAWWEFAAACGSTLGVFALFREALLEPDPPAPRIRRLLDAYFPWIGGLHILLDYLIDQAEDRAGGDLNLVEPYGDAGRAGQGLSVFVHEAARRAARLRDAPLHRLVVDGLLGLYLSDPKVAQQLLEPVARHLLASGGAGARLCFAASRFFRRWRRPRG